MSEPSRLVDDAVAPEIADLLRSAERDVPPDEQEQKRRIFASASSSGALRGAAGAGAQSRSLRNVAWIGLAVAVFTIGAVGIHATTSAGAPHRAELPRHSAPVVVNAGVNVPAAPSGLIVEAPAALPSLRVEELPSAIPPPRESAPPSASARREPSQSVEDELKVIDAARGALAANQPAAAQAHIQRYRVMFQRPHFVDEADALEVQALAALGRSDEARTKAERFLEAHPGSPYTQRVRSAAGLRSGAVDPRQ